MLYVFSRLETNGYEVYVLKMQSVEAAKYGGSWVCMYHTKVTLQFLSLKANVLG
jgi:hypothetical protein